MKKLSKIVITLSLILVITLTLILIPKNSKNVDLNNLESFNNDMLSIMIQKDLGGGDYIESATNSFPQDYYNFNAKLSKCLNGSKLKYNEDTKTVNVETAKTDKCYAYFDKNSYAIEYEYTGHYERFVVPVDGEYKIELWGAQGGYTKGRTSVGGKGAYVVGNIKLTQGGILYIFVGENDNTYVGACNKNPERSFNGTTESACTLGGGATDVRLSIVTDGAWYNFDSLKSRIMVAAGGGSSAPDYPGTGGYGGGLTGGDGVGIGSLEEYYPGKGATQESYTFGKAIYYTCNPGNGYYAGQAGHGGNGGGGSSFISGYPGCNAIDEKSTESNIIHTNQPIHYSGKVFTESKMIPGNEEMPKPDGGTEVGHEGNGYAKITLVK